MTIRSKKPSSFNETFDHLVHVFATEKLHVGTMTAEMIEALKYPATVPELQYFFGPCKVHGRIVPNFTKLSSLLNKKQRKEEPLQFNLDKKEANAAEAFKETLMTPPVLALLRWNGQ